MAGAAGIVALALILSCDVAYAHGGSFREDGGVPPPAANPGTLPLPSLPPTTGNPGALPGGRNRARRITSYSPLAWRHWWVLHRDGTLPAAGASTRRDPITGSPEAPSAGTLGASDWLTDQQRKERLVRLVIEPMLARMARREDLDPQELAATLIAWARCASKPPELRWFVRRTIGHRYRLEVRESAVIAIGLLRRSNPRARFDAEYLDEARRFLEDVTAAATVPRSVRVFAALSLALLADQPFAPKTPAEAMRTSRALWLHVRDRNTHYSLQHASILAIGMQPRTGIPPDVVDLLQRIARGRVTLRRKWDETTRAHALAALARLDHTNWRTIAKVVVRSQHQPDVLKYTAVTLLGKAAAQMPRWEREDVAKLLRRAAVSRNTPKRMRGQVLISLGRAFSAAAADPGAGMPELRKTVRVLDDRLRKAKLRVRPFAALGLGMGVRDMLSEDLERHKLAKEVRAILVKTTPTARGSGEAVAAHALACGLAQADALAPWLIEQLTDKNAPSVLRSHCALALGLLGRGYKPIREALRAAAIDRKSPGIHLYAVRALTMLGEKHIPALLTKNMDETRSHAATRVLVLGLARTARSETIAPLLEMAGESKRPAYVRSMGIASLGVMADPEPRPSRTRLVPSLNRYLLSAELLRFLNVL